MKLNLLDVQFEFSSIQNYRIQEILHHVDEAIQLTEDGEYVFLN